MNGVSHANSAGYLSNGSGLEVRHGSFKEALAYADGTKSPQQRLTRKKYLQDHMSPERLQYFHVTGAEEYVPPRQYEAETEDYTERELAKLRQQLLHGDGAWVSKLSVQAQQRMKTFLSDTPDQDQDQEDD